MLKADLLKKLIGSKVSVHFGTGQVHIFPSLPASCERVVTVTDVGEDVFEVEDVGGGKTYVSIAHVCSIKLGEPST